MSSPTLSYVVAPRSVDVLPTRARRRLTRRDGLLPLVLALELTAGIAFGLASTAGSTAATSSPARVTLGAAPLVTVLPSTSPVALVVAGPVASPTPAGPAVGPLLPGQVRAAAVSEPLEQAPSYDVSPATAEPAPYPTHPARDPFRSLVSAAS